MAKTILALLPERRDQQLAREALGRRYHLWLAKARNRALDIVRQGITPQLILAPMKSGDTTFLSLKEELSFLSPFKRAPFLIYVTEEERLIYAAQLRKADRIMPYPFTDIALLTAVDALLDRRRNP